MSLSISSPGGVLHIPSISIDERLHQACKKLNTDNVRTLVNSTNVNQEDSNGKTPLDYACEHYRENPKVGFEIIGILLERDAKIEHKDISFISRAFEAGYDDLALLFVKYGANVEKFSDGQVPILQAINFQSFETLILLFSEGMDVFASSESKGSIFQVILEENINFENSEFVNSFLKACLFQARSKDVGKLIKILTGIIKNTSKVPGYNPGLLGFIEEYVSFLLKRIESLEKK